MIRNPKTYFCQPQSKLAAVVNGTLTEITEDDLDGVFAIPMRAFENCYALTTVFLPDSVESVDNECFNGDSALRAIRLSENLQDLAPYVLNGCERLTSIRIPASVKLLYTHCLYIGSTEHPYSVTFLGPTPPKLSSNDIFNPEGLVNIFVPRGSLSAYQTAWSGTGYEPYLKETE